MFKNLCNRIANRFAKWGGGRYVILQSSDAHVLMRDGNVYIAWPKTDNWAQNASVATANLLMIEAIKVLFQNPKDNLTLYEALIDAGIGLNMTFEQINAVAGPICGIEQLSLEVKSEVDVQS